MAPLRIVLGNLILDMQKYRKEHGHKWPIKTLLLGGFLLWLFKAIRKSKATQVTSISSALADSPYLYKLRCLDYNPGTGILRGEMMPSGAFARFFTTAQKAKECEVELAHCSKFTESGHNLLRGLLSASSPTVYIRVDEVVGPQCLVKGFLYARLRGRVRQISINEELLRSGQSEFNQPSWEETNEDRLDRIEELRLSELYAKLSGQGKWQAYHKNSAQINVVGNWLQYKSKLYFLRNRRLLRQFFW
jgi:hypothetical protein